MVEDVEYVWLVVQVVVFAVVLVHYGLAMGHAAMSPRLPHFVLFGVSSLALLSVSTSVVVIWGDAVSNRAYVLPAVLLRGVAECAFLTRGLLYAFVDGMTVELLTERPQAHFFHRNARYLSVRRIAAGWLAYLAARVALATAAPAGQWQDMSPSCRAVVWLTEEGVGLATYAGISLCAARNYLHTRGALARELFASCALCAVAVLAGLPLVASDAPAAERARILVNAQLVPLVAVVVSLVWPLHKVRGRAVTPAAGAADGSGRKDHGRGHKALLATLDDLLENPRGYVTFRDFMMREWAAENVLFWGAVKDYRQTAERMLAQLEQLITARPGRGGAASDSDGDDRPGDASPGLGGGRRADIGTAEQTCYRAIHSMALALFDRFVVPGSTHDVQFEPTVAVKMHLVLSDFEAAHGIHAGGRSGDQERAVPVDVRDLPLSRGGPGRFASAAEAAAAAWAGPADRALTPPVGPGGASQHGVTWRLGPDAALECNARAVRDWAEGRMRYSNSPSLSGWSAASDAEMPAMSLAGSAHAHQQLAMPAPLLLTGTVPPGGNGSRCNSDAWSSTTADTSRSGRTRVRWNQAIARKRRERRIVKVRGPNMAWARVAAELRDLDSQARRTPDDDDEEDLRGDIVSLVYVFDDAQHVVLCRLQESGFQPFLRSDDYVRLLGALRNDAAASALLQNLQARVHFLNAKTRSTSARRLSLSGESSGAPRTAGWQTDDSSRSDIDGDALAGAPVRAAAHEWPASGHQNWAASGEPGVLGAGGTTAPAANDLDLVPAARCGSGGRRPAAMTLSPADGSAGPQLHQEQRQAAVQVVADTVVPASAFSGGARSPDAEAALFIERMTSPAHASAGSPVAVSLEDDGMDLCVGEVDSVPPVLRSKIVSRLASSITGIKGANPLAELRLSRRSLPLAGSASRAPTATSDGDEVPAGAESAGANNGHGASQEWASECGDRLYGEEDGVLRSASATYAHAPAVASPRDQRVRHLHCTRETF